MDLGWGLGPGISYNLQMIIRCNLFSLFCFVANLVQKSFSFIWSQHIVCFHEGIHSFIHSFIQDTWPIGIGLHLAIMGHSCRISSGVHWKANSCCCFKNDLTVLQHVPETLWSLRIKCTHMCVHTCIHAHTHWITTSDKKCGPRKWFLSLV